MPVTISITVSLTIFLTFRIISCTANTLMEMCSIYLLIYSNKNHVATYDHLIVQYAWLVVNNIAIDKRHDQLVS